MAVEMPKVRRNEAKHPWESFPACQSPYHQPRKGAGTYKGHAPEGTKRRSLNSKNNTLNGKPFRKGNATAQLPTVPTLLRCEDNNVDSAHVQPHYYRVRHVEPCHHLG